jgi:thymidylate synthase ThyX
MISAKIIADSINSKTSDRLTTFVLTFPRMVLSEYNTHKMLSKNSASSRAIPYKKMLKMVRENPFIPIYFQEDHSGMQGSKNITGLKLKLVKFLWLKARDCAVLSSLTLNKLGVTKQLTNRILEPFMWHTIITTGTEWENFFALRAHPAAEIHIQKLAYLMLEEYNKSIPEIKIPRDLDPQEWSYNKDIVNANLDWHIPFGDKIPDNLSKFEKIKVAIARIARISYNTFDGEINVEKDFELYNRLLGSTPIHASPAEMVAFPITESKFIGNLKGWYSFRKLLPQENAKDDRVIKKIVKDEVVVNV